MTVNKNPQNLAGARVFIVEDEFAVLLLVEDMLTELGCTIAGAASLMSEAVAMAGSLDLDAAVLDYNINGEPVDPVAELLAARQVPMVFSTGYGRSAITSRWRACPILQKPYRTEELATALGRAIGGRQQAR